MKKIIALSLIIAIVAMSAIGCGGKDANTDSSASAEQELSISVNE